MTLRFPDLDTLHLAVAGGVIPAETLVSPCDFHRNTDGSLELTPAQPLPDDALTTLQRLGVGSLEGKTSERIEHWFQAFPVSRKPALPDFGPTAHVLFDINDEDRLRDFVNEMMRLGCDRLSIGVVEGDEAPHYLIRSVGPPFYSLLRAVERHGSPGPIAFTERSPRLWIEAGYTHEFESSLDVPDGRLQLVRRTGIWETLPEPNWRDVYDVIRIDAPTATAWADEPLLEPISIPLRLVPDGGDVLPSMWVIRANVTEQLDRFVESADERRLASLAFAIGDGIAVLRLRPTRLPRPEIALDAVACRSVARLPHVFAPVGYCLSPPLRRETVRKLIAPDPGSVTWLTSEPDGTLSAEWMPDEAFRPLASWVDQVLSRDRAALEEWARAAEFAFDVTQVVEDAPTVKPGISAAKAKPTESRPAARKPERQSAKRPSARAVVLNPTTVQAGTPQISERRRLLRELEAQFLAIDGPLNHAARLALWPKLAALHAELRQPAEAALAWAHAAWESEPTPAALNAWLASEADGNDLAGTIDRLLAEFASTATLRCLTAIVCWAASQTPIPADVQARSPAIQSHLAIHEHVLPVRLAWLAWSAWCRLAGGDVVALARARDRVLERLLDRGLTAETDLPAFLRFAGRHDSDRLRDVRGWVEEIRDRLRGWYQSQRNANGTPIDLATDPTAAYIDLLFAFAFARLADATAARGLVREADAVLSASGDETREAHAFLYQAFAWRVEEVLAGRPHAGPLPTELLDYLAHVRQEESKMPATEEYGVRRRCSYAVERMREQSRVLEPQEKFNPYRGSIASHESNELVREASQLPEVQDVGQLPARITDLLRRVGDKPAVRLRLLAEAVPLAGRLGASAASTLLNHVLPALDGAPPTADVPALETRLRLIERSLFFAAHYDRGDLVAGLVERLLRLIESDVSTAALESVGPVVGQTLRSLRRLGLRDESLRIMDRIAAVVSRGQTIEQLLAARSRSAHQRLVTLTYLAAGWRGFDQCARAAPVLAAARSALVARAKLPQDRLPPSLYKQLLCAYVAAVGAGPPAEARTEFADLFAPRRLEPLANTMTTSVFFSWFHLNVVEAVVLTLASDDFALEAAARRRLDEDEFLVRRRIHRDVRSALEAQG